MRSFAVLAVLLAAACSTATPAVRALPTPSPSPLPTLAPIPVVTTAAPTAVPTTARPRPTLAPWVVGASPLPLRSDGFGEVLTTPPQLRNRHLQQPDDLPPPPDGKWHATSSAIDDQLRQRMGDTYKSNCPVPLSDLRYLTLVFRGFDGQAHTGELVVASRAVPPTENAFHRLFELGFPLEQMVLPGTADVHAKPTGDGNDTAAFVCRAARQQTRFSAHAYGLAIDVNPFQNPYVKGDLVIPELASAYVDRNWKRDGMFRAGSPAVRAFTDQGFTWGGTFHRPKDYQHMSLSGN